MACKGKKSSKRKRIALTAAAVLMLAAAGAIVFALLSMHDSAAPSPAGDAPIEEAAVDSDGFPEVDWGYWQSVNPDVIGWVTVPGTEVNQPIVQAHSDDPQFYLHHDVYKKRNVYGVPYLDAECTGGLLGSPNAVVLGHHMSDGSVFAGLARYSTDAGFAKENTRVLIQTPTEKKTLNVRFARIVDATSVNKRTSFLDATDHKTWYASELAAASVVVDDREAVPAQGVVCLCTCSYNMFDNERTLVYAS